MAKAEGRVFKYSSAKSIRNDFLESFPYAGNKQLIECRTKEFSAVCPFSGLPDLGDFVLNYIPNKKIIELKSLKYYLTSYRNVGITQEDATNKIFNDLVKVLNPHFLKLTLIYNTRGGIDTTCTMQHGKTE